MQTAAKREQESKQLSIVESFDKTCKWSNDHPRSKEIDDLILELVCCDCHPFNIVEGQSFKRLINKLQPKYNLKTEKFYSLLKSKEFMQNESC